VIDGFTALTIYLEMWLEQNGVDYELSKSPAILTYAINGEQGTVAKQGKLVTLTERAACDMWLLSRQDASQYPLPPAKLYDLKCRLVDRDGTDCFYCRQTFGLRDLTLEHILPRSKTGGDHMANLALACEPCNTFVSNKPIVEKIAFRDSFKVAA